MQPFTTVDEAWDALLAQRTSDHNDTLDLVEHAPRRPPALSAWAPMTS
jgi:hypothetical protein